MARPGRNGGNPLARQHSGRVHPSAATVAQGHKTGVDRPGMRGKEEPEEAGDNANPKCSR